jgi:methionine synthase II (cobalamin-independent)
MHNIDKNITIEYLVTEYPQTVRILMEKGIKCLACGEPIWGTLESNAKEKGYNNAEIDNLVLELRAFLEENTH